MFQFFIFYFCNKLFYLSIYIYIYLYVSNAPLSNSGMLDILFANGDGDDDENI